MPSSAISIAGTENNPVLIVAATRYFVNAPISTYVIAINLETKKLLWKVQTPYTTGQYPITVDTVNGELVFATTFGRGIRVIGKE
ncbi:MAG: hypothetical protein Fur0021_27390 [Candidatus Promineifilaceae bacterium]